MNALKIIISFVCGFLLSQGIKTTLAIGRKEKDIKKYLLGSGGMPSGHTAGVVAATTCIGCLEGTSASLFGFAIVMCAIIIYDALNVRRAVGEQGKLLNKLSPKKLKIVEGHTISEVFIGVILGVLIGLVFGKVF